MADMAVKQLTAAYESIGQYSKHGLHPEEFLTYDFLHKHPILLQPGMLRVDWNRISGLTRRITTIPTVVVPDSLWARWLHDWKDTWEPDKDPGHFVHNMALVICRSRFNDNPDIKRQGQMGIFDGECSCPAQDRPSYPRGSECTSGEDRARPPVRNLPHTAT